MQPGNVIAPHDESPQASDPQVQDNISDPGSDPLVETSASAQQATAPPEETNAATSQLPEVDSNAFSPAASLPDDIQWTAAEFIEHRKSFGWYGLLCLAGLVLAVANYLVTKAVFSTAAILAAIMMLGLYAARKPHTRQYCLNPQGLQIGEKMYAFQSFKNFSVIDEGEVSSIVFAPLGRFVPPLTIYVSSDIERSVLDYLGMFLPIEEHRSDAIDGLLRRIRF